MSSPLQGIKPPTSKKESHMFEINTHHAATCPRGKEVGQGMRASPTGWRQMLCFRFCFCTDVESATMNTIVVDFHQNVSQDAKLSFTSGVTRHSVGNEFNFGNLSLTLVDTPQRIVAVDALAGWCASTKFIVSTG